MKRLLVLAVLALAACQAPPAALFQAVALGEVARAQAEAGDAAGARESAALALEAAESVTKGYRLEAFGAAAVARTRAGDPAAAFEIAERLAETDERAAAFIGLALARADLGDAPGARAAADRALDVAEDIANANHRETIRAVAVRAQAEADDWAGVIDTVENIADRKIRAGALAQVVEVRVAAGDLTAALATARSIPNVDDDDDVTVSSVLLRGLAVGVHRALDALFLGAGMPPRLRALSLVAVAQSEAWQEDAAGQTFALALDTARAVEHVSKRRKALEAVALAQARTGDAAAALRTLREAGSGDEPAKTLALVAIAAAARGDTLAAAETLRGLPANRDRFDSLARVALAAVASGRLWAAEDALEFALEPAESEEDGPAPQLSWLVSRVAAARAEAGDRAEAQRLAAVALDLIPAIRSRGERGFASVFAASAQAAAGDIRGALATVRRITDSE